MSAGPGVPVGDQLVVVDHVVLVAPVQSGSPGIGIGGGVGVGFGLALPYVEPASDKYEPPPCARAL